MMASCLSSVQGNVLSPVDAHAHLAFSYSFKTDILSSGRITSSTIIFVAQRSCQLVAYRSSRTAKVSPIQAAKGFGPPRKIKSPPKKVAQEKLSRKPEQQEEDKEDDTSEEEEDSVVPEVVTNRMLKRLSLTVGIPLALGISFFPLYYYLKVVQRVNIPEWLPFFTSMFTFGFAGIGITYGLLSASWDPSRAGTLLGLKEAQLNWPIFWERIRGDNQRK